MEVNFINPQGYEIAELGTAMARTSRDHRGFDAIIKSVAHLPVWERSEAIMKFTEYGHASILDLIEIPLSFEDITMYQAARLFQFSPRGAGQEASTRYINTNPEWQATYEEKRKAGRLDEIRGAILVSAPTSVVLRQSLRDWIHVLAYCHYAGEAPLTELSEEIYEMLCAIFTPVNFGYVKSYLGGLENPETKGGKSFADKINVLVPYVERTEMLRLDNIREHWFVEVVQNIPFYLVRDLNRHRRRIETGWTTPWYNNPMSQLVQFHMFCTLEQFKYELGTRTTKEADPGYKALYLDWAERLSIEL